MILKISLSNQLRVFFIFNIKVIALIPIGVFYLYYKGITDWLPFLVIMGLLLLIANLGVFYLHIGYYIINHGQTITLENYELTLMEKNGNISKYKYNELDRIFICRSPSIDKGGIPVTPMDYYHYIRIFTKSDKQIIITCLMHPDLNKVLEELKDVKQIRLKGLSVWNLRKHVKSNYIS